MSPDFPKTKKELVAELEAATEARLTTIGLKLFHVQCIVWDAVP